MMIAEGPLSGLLVVETGSLIAGPYCGQLLGDLGATVIKLEPPVAGDAFRTWGQHTEEGDGVWWASLGRNKQSVTCNLRTEAGQQILRDLCARADILVENFRPGTLERWGLAPEVLMELNPRLIVAQVSGFGQTGPYAAHAGYASIGEAMAGFRYLAGYPDQPPVRVGLSIGDSLAGIFSCIGVLAALREREVSGLGQTVDTSIYESVLAMTESLLGDYALFDVIRERTGPVLPGIAPSNAYPTADGLSVIIAANQDTVFSRLAATMGRSELAQDARFATHVARGTNMAELDDLIGEWTAARESAQLLAELNEAGVPAGRINRAPEILVDPQVVARESVAWVDDAVLGSVPMPNVVPRLGRTPGRIRSTGPRLGEHTDHVLQDVLGYDPDRIAEMRSAGEV
jgi:formyl-CoA transferase